MIAQLAKAGKAAQDMSTNGRWVTISLQPEGFAIRATEGDRRFEQRLTYEEVAQARFDVLEHSLERLSVQMGWSS